MTTKQHIKELVFRIDSVCDSLDLFLFQHGKIPMPENLKVKATKAVELAVLLLGEKCPQAIIQLQAMAFMQMNEQALTESIDRFIQTQELYLPKPRKKKS